jgi:hypothetical protein
MARTSWDTSEGRRNSFPLVDEHALSTIQGTLHIVAHLAPEDPRRSDLEHRALSKLRRVIDVDVKYESATSIGLFEQTGDKYGEIWYELNGRRAVSRVTTAEGVLETIYELAQVSGPRDEDREIFRGYPLPVAPAGAAAIFYGLWPAAVAALAFFTQRRHS